MKKLMTRGKILIIDFLLRFRAFQGLIGRRWFKRWEKKYIPAEPELLCLTTLLPRDVTALDIGANRGEISYYLATVCHARVVYAIEPQGRMFGVLQGVAEKLPQILPYQIAFSEAAGIGTISIPLRSGVRYTQNASLEKIHDLSSTVTEGIRLCTVDAFAKEHGIERIDFIKCDTEGHELNIFKGAIGILSSSRPLVLMEIYPAKGLVHRRQVFRFFENLGYTAYALEQKSSELVCAHEGTEYLSANYFFLPNERDYIPLKI